MKDIPVITPIEQTFATHVYHLYVIRSKKRDLLQKWLRRKGIITQIHYPMPIYYQPAYKYLGYKKGDFPTTEKLTKEILSLPMSAELDRNEIEYVCASIKEFFIKNVYYEQAWIN